MTRQKKLPVSEGKQYVMNEEWHCKHPQYKRNVRKSTTMTYGNSERGNFLPHSIYSQTSLNRVSLIRMPHNPNTLPGNLF